MVGNKGFTMIELLVVLLIVGVLAAVAAPMYLAHTEKAKVSEAVGVMSLMRQAEREYRVTRTTAPLFLAVAGGNIEADPDATPAGLNIMVGPSQYFSRECYSVAVPGAFTDGTAAADFVITATGSASVPFDAATGIGARKDSEVEDYIVQMDNSGRIVYTTDGTNWKQF